MDVLHFFVGVFGNATALFFFLAPTITFKRIIWSKSTEQFSGIPYVMTLLNCLISAWYGLPFVSKNNLLVSTISGTGAVIETIFVLIFIIYAPRKEKYKILGLLTLVLTIFATVAFVSLYALHDNTRKLFCGYATTIFSIIMYSSPLSIIVPSGLGCGLGLIQLILYFIYRNKKDKDADTNQPTSESVEVGTGKPQQEKQMVAYGSVDERV
ncbi:hypothetical protein GH714_021706 [Hevea brasiliensis]|uniref:Bidirectional sugar transporter SWEET n=1 Tax=Hevea brasiliensis TaxID=3981 RepID=A0A6A6LZI0_HEVBR|nr:hypothetical protein GH714_021706 [Hevea brasiliensis]